MKYKSARVRAAYHLFLIALIAVGVVGIVTLSFAAANAEKAPTPQDGHCTLIVDGDTCYIVTLPGCNWVMTKFGQDSMGVTLECDPVKGE